MIDDLDSSCSILRLIVSQALKQWNIDSLLKLLTEEDVIVRTAAARELHVRGGSETFEKVKRLSCDEREFVREISAFTLGQLATPSYPYKNESIPILCVLLKDSDSEVRAAAAAALGHLCYKEMPAVAEEALLLAAKDINNDVRACVAYALGNSSGSDLVIKALNKLKTDKDDSVRSYAVLGMELLDKALQGGHEIPTNLFTTKAAEILL